MAGENQDAHRTAKVRAEMDIRISYQVNWIESFKSVPRPESTRLLWRKGFTSIYNRPRVYSFQSSACMGLIRFETGLIPPPISPYLSGLNYGMVTAATRSCNGNL